MHPLKCSKRPPHHHHHQHHPRPPSTPKLAPEGLAAALGRRTVVGLARFILVSAEQATQGHRAHHSPLRPDPGGP